MTKNKNSRVGWNVHSIFSIGLHKKDLNLLIKLKDFFNCGIIIKNDKLNEVSFRVNSLQDLVKKIIPHFNKYQLLSQKSVDFKLFKEVIKLMQNKSHLTAEGLQEIISIKSSLNLGLSEELKFSFPKIKTVKRSIIIPTSIPDFHWISIKK